MTRNLLDHLHKDNIKLQIHCAYAIFQVCQTIRVLEIYCQSSYQGIIRYYKWAPVDLGQLHMYFG